VFLIGFPLAGVPRLSTVTAIAASLLLETSGFGAGVARYTAMRLVDGRTAASIVAVTLPAGAAGAIAARHAPVAVLRIGYGLLMIALAVLLAAKTPGPPAGQPGAGPALVRGSEASHPPCGRGQARRITAATGRVYAYCAHGLGGQRAISGAGAFLVGLISTGVGEATLPGLVRRSRLPVPVAAATSTVIVAGTVVGAAATHLVQLTAAGGLSAVPWNLLAWAVPGAIAGAVIGTRLQGRVSKDAARRFFAGLFAAIGITFLLAFTVFVHRFWVAPRAARVRLNGAAEHDGHARRPRRVPAARIRHWAASPDGSRRAP
jgi:uncharacterized membrane protein YfcA